MAYQKSIGSGKTSRTYIAVTPHDTNALTNGECQALFIGTSGDLTCVDAAGNATLFKNLPNAYTLSVQTLIVKSTGTTANDIVALY